MSGSRAGLPLRTVSARRSHSGQSAASKRIMPVYDVGDAVVLARYAVGTNKPAAPVSVGDMNFNNRVDVGDEIGLPRAQIHRQVPEAGKNAHRSVGDCKLEIGNWKL